MDYLQSALDGFTGYFVGYSNIDYKLWIYRLLMVLLTPFLIQFFFAGVYLTGVLINVVTYLITSPFTNDKYFKVPSVYYYLWNTVSSIFNGYEIVGLENIPKSGPGLIIFYHSPTAVDLFYFGSQLLWKLNRGMDSVTDRRLTKFSGGKILQKSFNFCLGEIESCVEILKDGRLLMIAPGGVYEAQFSDNTYKIMWQERVGFAKVALEAQVPIIPCFTQNCREFFWQTTKFRKTVLKIYKATKLPPLLIYAVFPVKLRTFIGKPIQYDGSLTAQELKNKVQTQMEALIKEHQRIPGSIPHALLDRFPFFRKNNKNQVSNKAE